MKNKKISESVSGISDNIYETCGKIADCTDTDDMNGGNNDGAQSSGAHTDGVRLFTQRELEKCIGERLMRERRNNSSLELIRDMVDGLRKEGIISADSYAKAALELSGKLEAMQAENTRKEEHQSESLGAAMEPSGEAESEDLAAEDDLQMAKEYSEVCISDATDNGNEQKVPEKGSDQLMRECDVLSEKYPHIDIEALLDNESFKRYCKRKGGSLTELYEGFSALMLSIEKFGDSIREKASDYEPLSEERFRESDRHFAVRSLSSTGFSKGSASANADTGALLSPMQRDIARRAGISYREYAELMRDIPDAGKIKRQAK